MSKFLFDPEKSTLLIPVSQAILGSPEADAFAEKNGFEKKVEFHATVIGFQTGAKIKELIAKDSNLLPKLEALMESTDWKVVPLPSFHVLAKDYSFVDAAGKKQNEHRESIIQGAEVPSIKAFYAGLNNLISDSIEVPLTHITLYTKGTDKERSRMGIRVNNLREWQMLKPVPINKSASVKKILVPSRPQPDTIVAVFVLQTFGRETYPGIENAPVEVIAELPKGETADSYLAKGFLCLDIGGGDLDHHAKNPPVTCSELVSLKLGVKDDPALAKLLEYTRRDDIVGKGTVSSDALDRAFGLSGLVAAMNKTRPNDAAGIVRDVLPLLAAHYNEELKRTKELPQELDALMKAGKTDVFEVRQRDKKLKVIILESDNTSMPGYLRSALGGRFDVVVQRMAAGHTNVLTRPTKWVDLRSLALVIRLEESNQMGIEVSRDPKYLSQSGRIKEVPNWYYDDATNSIQNGGANPKDTIPTRIDPFVMKKLVEAGLSEAVWSPLNR